jgi:hypothetical protein
MLVGAETIVAFGDNLVAFEGPSHAAHTLGERLVV